MIDLGLLSRMTPEERAEFDSLLLQDSVVWRPDPDNKPQSMAFRSDADVIGFGGAAGGGKSELALGMALTRHRRVQIFRREGTELGGLIDRLAEILKHRHGLAGKPAVWRNPTPTCELIEFCSAPHLGDESKYMGRPKDLLVFDEASNFLEHQVRFMSTWLRSTDPAQKLTLLLTFNPPTSVEGRWILAFFAPWLDKKHPRPAKPGELRWFAMVGGKETEVESGDPFDHEGQLVTPKSRTFIPSRVTDNKYLARTNYMAQLESLPEPLRSQMRDGDFSAGVEDDPYQVIPTAWVEAAMARWKPLDVKPPMDSLGVDVALGGKDNNVLQRRHGWWFDVPIVYPRSALDQGSSRVERGRLIAGWCISALRNNAVIHLDLFGVGAEPYGCLMETQQQVMGVSMGETTVATTAGGRLGFSNVRSMLWWRAREALNPDANNGIALPPDRNMLADLCAATWEPVGSKIKVHDRETIVAKIGRSPDYATALILAMIDTAKAIEIDRLTNPLTSNYSPLERFDEQFGGVEQRKRPGTDPLGRM